MTGLLMFVLFLLGMFIGAGVVVIVGISFACKCNNADDLEGTVAIGKNPAPTSAKPATKPGSLPLADKAR